MVIYVKTPVKHLFKLWSSNITNSQLTNTGVSSSETQ